MTSGEFSEPQLTLVDDSIIRGNSITRRTLLLGGLGTVSLLMLEACGAPDAAPAPASASAPAPTTAGPKPNGAPSPATAAPTSPAAPSKPNTAPSQKPEASAEDFRAPKILYRSLQVISMYEYSTIVPQFGRSEVVKDENGVPDGRGITSGIVGTTTGTGDSRVVIKKYTKEVPKNPLKKYLPRLDVLEAEFAETSWSKPVGSLQGLKGYNAAWKKCAKDPKFQQAQIDVYEELNVNHAINWAAKVKTADGKGVTSTAGVLILTDTVVQLGANNEKEDGKYVDEDGLPNLILEAQKRVGNKPTEAEFINALCDVRREHLETAWPEAIPRVDSLQKIYKETGGDLRKGFGIDGYDDADHKELPPL